MRRKSGTTSITVVIKYKRTELKLLLMLMNLYVKITAELIECFIFRGVAQMFLFNISNKKHVDVRVIRQCDLENDLDNYSSVSKCT